MAITGTKLFSSGEVLTAANVNQYLMRGLKVYADAATRTAAYGGAGKPTLEEGEASYLLDSNQAYVYDGTQWVPVGGAWTGTVASATSIAVLPNSQYLLTGTTQTNTATGGTAGARLILTASGQAAGVCVIIGHGTGAGNFTLRDGVALGLYAGESLQFVHNGTAWVETARNLAKVLSYVQTTSQVFVTATTEATANAAVTAAAITFDGTSPILVEVYSSRVVRGTTWISDCLYQDSTSLGYFMSATSASSDRVPYYAARRFTPAAGSKTYSWRLWVDAGTGSVVAGAGTSGNQPPAFIRISREV